MIKEGKMTEFGLVKVKSAKKNGQWNAVTSTKQIPPIPAELLSVLEKNKKALENFRNFAPSYRLMYIYWVLDAKREETRQRRIKKVVEFSEQNKKLGMV